MGTGTAELDVGPVVLAATNVAPHGTGTARMVVGSVATASDGTPVPGIVLTATGPRPSLALFDDDWHTKTASLKSQDFAFRDEFTATGSITFSIRLDDPSIDLTSGGKLVKAYWKGKSRVASPLRKSTTKLVVDKAGVQRAWRTWEAQQGLLSALNDGIVLPEYGIGRAASDTRTFGFMSRRDDTTDEATWTSAIALPYADDTGVRAGIPAALKGLGASWISKHGSYVTQAANYREWLVYTFTTYSEFDYEYLDAFDDHRELWLDDEQLGGIHDANGQSFRYLNRVTGTMPIGPHKLAIELTNSNLTKPNNPVAYIAAMRILNAKGEPVKGPPYLVTGSQWLAADDVHGMHKAECVLKIWEENARWPIAAFHKMHPGWTDDADTSDEDWPDFGRPSQPIGRGLLDVVQEYGEQSFDASVDASTLTVHLHKRLGTNRSGSVTLQLAAAAPGVGSLKNYEVTRTEPRYNVAFMHLEDDTWTLREDASTTDDNRAAIGLEMGSTAWVSTANATAEAMFDETAHVTREFDNVEISLNRGPQPYEQFWPGDTVTARDEAGGALAVRVMAITVKVSEDVVRVFLDLMEDRSA